MAESWGCRSNEGLIHTTVVLAMSVDGKISDRGRSPARFGSAADQAHLEAQVAFADAVVFGAGTLRAYGTTMSVRDEALKTERRQRQQQPQPVQIVCSPSGDLDTSMKFFRQPVPRWLLTTGAGAERWRGGDEFDRVWQAPLGAEDEIDWRQVWAELAERGLERVAVLGGGQLTAALFAAGLVDELWLTVCPLVLGGSASPTPVDGLGFVSGAAPQLKLRSVKQQDDELFLHYVTTTDA